MGHNAALNKAGKAKKDEFYTQLSDIESEMKHYRKHFSGKTVLCNCDDPFESNFFKYFCLNFNRLRLKKLIATCYSGSPITGNELILFGDGTEEERRTPYKAIVTSVHDANGDGATNMIDVAELFKQGENKCEKLEGNGDFRSAECEKLLDEADIVVTNPPFSLFREYVGFLVSHNKKFIIIGSQNALTYKEIFPLIRDNQMWLGYGFGGMAFKVPPDYEPRATRYWQDDSGQKWRSLGNVCWFTNLDIKKRHDELILVKRYNPDDYLKYDNYDAINVNKVIDIPCDYSGVMGVPITFMDKYNPAQFEIVGLIAGNIRGLAGIPSSTGKDGPYIDGKLKFGRILVRNLHPEPQHYKEG